MYSDLSSVLKSQTTGYIKIAGSPMELMYCSTCAFPVKCGTLIFPCVKAVVSANVLNANE